MTSRVARPRSIDRRLDLGALQVFDRVMREIRSSATRSVCYDVANRYTDCFPRILSRAFFSSALGGRGFFANGEAARGGIVIALCA